MMRCQAAPAAEAGDEGAVEGVHGVLPRALPRRAVLPHNMQYNI